MFSSPIPILRTTLLRIRRPWLNPVLECRNASTTSSSILFNWRIRLLVNRHQANSSCDSIFFSWIAEYFLLPRCTSSVSWLKESRLTIMAECHDLVWRIGWSICRWSKSEFRICLIRQWDPLFSNIYFRQIVSLVVRSDIHYTSTYYLSWWILALGSSDLSLYIYSFISIADRVPWSLHSPDGSPILRNLQV